MSDLDESQWAGTDYLMSSIEYDYVLFIDEAGDDGLKRVKPIDKDGSSEWLVLSGLLVRAEDEGRCRQWLDNIRTDIDALQSSVLHFSKLSPSKRRRAAVMLSELPVRCFSVCSNKKNMRGYNNPRAAKAGSRQWFYNWILRVLMERATSFCLENSMRKFGRPSKMKVLFSSRGGHSYGQTKAYWEKLRIGGRPKLDKRQIRFEVLSYQLVDYVPHYYHAGLQLADICASAFYQAVDTSSTRWTIDNAKALTPIVAKSNGAFADTGIVLLPAEIDADLTSEQKLIFRHFGYTFHGG
ncbi:DUF3800 domain-containing protein [Paracoccus kondratievae]|uniref:DUF3800 domain-containing protein n=1 Tax=Paracoccus kondratievae TaxID=135740 RepID=UPI0018791D2C|nr:DUF3800 domain-containing protein [Paracoccus kondratievae]